MVAGIFESLQSIGEGFISFLVSLFESIVGIVYTPGAEGAFGSFTFIGTFILIGCVAGLVFFVFRSLLRIINLR